MAQYKICRTCNSNKETNQFSKRNNSKDGFRNDCKLCDKKRKEVYYFNNKERLDTIARIWRDNNSDVLKINNEKFNLENPNYNKEYYQKNKIEITKRNKQRRNNEPLYKLKENIRHLISNSLKYNGFKKETKTINILGIDNDNFKKYLESMFDDWMNWDNYGNPKDGIYELNKTWDIDHITPVSSGMTEKEIIKLNHFSNLQPLCSYTNRFIKRNKTI